MKRKARTPTKGWSAYDRAGWFSKYSFKFLWPLVERARRRHRPIAPEELDCHAPRSALGDQAKVQLAREWSREVAQRGVQASMLAAIARTYKYRMVLVFLLNVGTECLLDPALFWLATRLIDLIGQFPIVAEHPHLKLHANLSYEQMIDNAQVATNQTSTRQATTQSPLVDSSGIVESDLSLQLKCQELIANAVAIVGVFLMSILLMYPYNWTILTSGLQLRVALSQMVYSKTLKINTSQRKVNYKQAISLISRDIDVLDADLTSLAWIVTGPIACIILTLITSQSIGYATASVSLAVSALSALNRSAMNLLIKRHQHAASRASDQRVMIINETLRAIRILRMFAWTQQMADRIHVIRMREVNKRRYRLMLRGVDIVIFFIGCSGGSLITLAFGYYVMNLDITQIIVSQVFLIGLMNRRALSRNFALGLNSWVNVTVVLERVSKYLLADELEPRLEMTTSAVSKPGEVALTIQGLDEVNRKASLKVQDISSSVVQQKKPTLVKVEQLSAGWPDSSPGKGEVGVHKRPQNRRLVSARSRPMQGSLMYKPSCTNNPNANQKRICFEGLDFELAEGDLMIVSGKVGSGKSTLMQVILRELEPVSGRVLLAPQLRISYASQDAWVFSGTIRENILFGDEFKPQRYYETLRVCSLLHDLRSFPNLDRTQIGERGATLSGGQRARVSLARCLYQDAHLYLLDDVLSAVDARVARLIFGRAIKAYLSRKCVVLVTHQPAYLAYANKTLLLGTQGPTKPGANSLNHQYTVHAKPESLGSFEIEMGTAPHDLAPQAEQADQDEDEELDTYHVERLEASVIARIKQLDSGAKDHELAGSTSSTSRPSASSGSIAPGLLAYDTISDQYMTSVWRSFRFYMVNSNSDFEHTLFVIYSIFMRTMFVLISIWLTYWAGLIDRMRRAPDDEAKEILLDSMEDLTFGLAPIAAQLTFGQATMVSVVIWLGLFAVASIRAYQFYKTVYAGTLTIHNKLIRAILNTHMRFFDVTPQGQLINRISTDISYLDTNFVQQMDEISLVGISSAYIMFSIICSDFKMALGVSMVAILCYSIFSWCLRLVKTLKQVDGLRRGALYSHVSITLDSLATIRASQKQPMFLELFSQHQDRHSSVTFISMATRRIILNAIDWIMFLFYSMLVGFDVLNTLNGHGLYAFVGLNLIINMTRMFQVTFSNFIDFHARAQSLSRLDEYCRLEPEHAIGELAAARRSMARYGTSATFGPQYRGSISLPNTHEAPTSGGTTKATFARGRVEFVGVSLRYHHDGEIILKSLSFAIEPAEKIGVVGRTGAGKSSLVSVLYNLYHFEGFVFIDNQDTKHLDVDSLRKCISIIPQDPVLFSGTLRYNLDPMNEHSEAKLWKALAAVQLSDMVKSMGSQAPLMGGAHSTHSAGHKFSGLDMQVGECGHNLSVGQRQLVCLCRAILRRNQVMILDEATANVDLETDKLIQQTIQNEFVNCTVITIAHRISTILDSDRIMVMDKGQVCEFDTPPKLLKAGGLFCELVDNTGKRVAERIRQQILKSDRRIEYDK